MDQLLIPFQYEYMQKAMLISALIGGVCALLSCFITLKGWSLMGDALAHAIVPGVSIAYICGIPFALGAFVSAMLAAATMGFVKSNTRIREDAVIGVVFTTFFALGLVLISVYPSSISLKTIALGNILGIADEDILQMVIISIFTLVVLACQWKNLLLFCFDANHARSLGLNVFFLNGLLLTLLSITAVAALQAVGACLVVAMLVTPGATAYLLTDRFGKMMALACIMGVGCSFAGAYISYFINGSTGGCIVVLQTLLFIVALIFAPKHGLLVNRARRKKRGGTPMTHPWLAPFQYDFMVQALLVGALVGAVCSILSCFLVLKGWSLMGDALSHAILPGIVIAYVAGIPLAIGAFFSGIFCAAATGFIKENTRIKEDTAMGIVFTGLFALGLVLFTKVESDVHLNHVLFGSLLGISQKDVIQTSVVGVITLIIILAIRKDLLLFCFDPGQARSIGLNTKLLYYVLLSLLAACIVVSLQAVGIILVIAMLITPGCIAYLWSDRFDHMLWIAAGSSILSCIIGIYISYFGNASTAGCIVLVQALIFTLTMFFAPKRGLFFRKTA